MRRRRRTLWLAGVAVALAALIYGATVATRHEQKNSGSATTTFAVPGRPSAVAVARGLVWIADDEHQAVHTIDSRSGEIVGHQIAVQRNPVALAAGDGSVWVAHASGAVVRIDTRTRRPDRPVAAGESITGIAVAGDRVWAADLPGNSLVEIDARSSRILRRIPVPEGAVRVVVAGPYLWVTNRERTVTRVNPDSGEAGPRVDVGLGPIGGAYDGRSVWVANSDDGTLSRITGTTVGGPISVGRGPVAVAVSGRTIAVANQDDGTLSLVRPSGEVHPEPVFLALSPRGMVAAGSYVWVVGAGGPTNQGAAVRVDLRRL